MSDKKTLREAPAVDESAEKLVFDRTTGLAVVLSVLLEQLVDKGLVDSQQMENKLTAYFDLLMEDQPGAAELVRAIANASNIKVGGPK